MVQPQIAGGGFANLPSDPSKPILIIILNIPYIFAFLNHYISCFAFLKHLLYLNVIVFIAEEDLNAKYLKK